MKTVLRILLGAGAVALPAWGVYRAAEPPAVAGHVLVLDNEHILEGEVLRQGDRYRIRRSLGETWVPAARVVRVCESKDEVYRYLRGRANLRDADERLRLARWCQLHRLREQGLAEAKAALELRPGSAEGQRLVQGLSKPLPPPTPGTVVAKPEPEPPTPLAMGLDLSLEAVGTFASRVQPILMNTCAGCHISDRGGSFKLVRVFDDGVNSPRATQHNMAAAIGQINKDNWQASPLLVKAVSVHGEVNKSPLKSRDVPAYHTLSEWVQLAVANVPPRELPSAVTAAAPALPATRGFAEGRTEVQTAGLKSNAEPKPMPTADTKATPPAPATPADPFDPAIFNQQNR